ncbi:MAG: YicC-like protein [Clostridia bacterium]|nr:YicC-like protein [Clostridia bacterium]
MTGYGRGREVIDGRDITVEIKSVNHRYFEMYAKISRTYLQLEDFIRSYLQKYIVRGKVDINVYIDTGAREINNIKLNKQLLKGYLDTLKEASTEFSLNYDISTSSLLKLPDVLTTGRDEENIQEVWQGVQKVLDIALRDFTAQRETEGERLAMDIIEKCKQINNDTAVIKSRADVLTVEYTQKLRQRIIKLLENDNFDEQRLLTEVAIMADKNSIDEELVRLASHSQSLTQLFMTGIDKISDYIPSGKKMDFIIQEMNREINTISSKIGDIETTVKVIEIKACIEKIREQVQNIE